MAIFDEQVCHLGEGPLWHPQRGELFWFDILGRTLHVRRPDDAAPDARRSYALPELFSAAAWIDADRLLLASETGLWVFDIESGGLQRLIGIEADVAQTRSNDGRADPWGGFWTSTMSKSAAPKAGALYRYVAGEMRQVAAELTIANAICFAPDKSCAYYADTALGLLYRQALDGDGWPLGARETFVDFAALGLNPDGAVTLADGSLRVALWGAGCVVAVAPDATLGARTPVGATQSSCPAFGGADFTTLFVTSATEHMTPEARRADPDAGKTFTVAQAGQGKAEPAFRLDLCGDFK
ncbi:L-arabinolactonase [Aquimixticola soesokkakensis]|uniref:L-arabinolactonase n=1 Tax=Aquimixticola soesokkakensis TaxID=1519096 RepID=A0A1Y5TGQ8_9RHOB|nr:SMP-30/gluconolactonase/LRE family protein [Aquimixticola soesokkakensis]SLN60015.1 L-arabinolactonase [Aquimixticola soesokkakensis]